MSQTNAAIAAGYSKSYAEDHSHALEKLSNMRDVFEQAGLTDKWVVDHARQGLEAKKIVSTGDGEFIEKEDWPVRHKYFETTLKLTGRMDKEETGGEKINKSIVIIYPPGYQAPPQPEPKPIDIENNAQAISS